MPCGPASSRTDFPLVIFPVFLLLTPTRTTAANVGTLLKENPRTTAYIHPGGVAQLVDPSLELAVRKRALPPKMHARIGEMEPVEPDRIRALNEGDEFDLGDGDSGR